MELKNQVCSLELAKKLKELGFKQESLFYWSTNDMEKKDECYQIALGIEKNGFYYPNVFSAYTVAELGEMFPGITSDGKCVFNFQWGLMHNMHYANIDDTNGNLIKQFEANTEADARAKTLCYLKENNLI